MRICLRSIHRGCSFSGPRWLHSGGLSLWCIVNFRCLGFRIVRRSFLGHYRCWGWRHGSSSGSYGFLGRGRNVWCCWSFRLNGLWSRGRFALRSLCYPLGFRLFFFVRTLAHSCEIQQGNFHQEARIRATSVRQVALRKCFQGIGQKGGRGLLCLLAVLFLDGVGHIHEGNGGFVFGQQDIPNVAR